jgi:hypothetical protein
MANKSHSGAHVAAAPVPGKYIPSARIKTIYAVAMFLGAILFALSMYQDKARAWHSFLTSYMFFIDLALGGLFFAAIQHVAKAGWSVTIRRFSEAFTAYLPIAAVGAIVLLFGARTLYVWLDPEVVANDALLTGKAPYLNFSFFLIRLIVFFALWLFFRFKIIGNSVKQDTDGDVNHTIRNVAWSVGFLIVFALSYSLFSVDLLMSLQPHWYSTMWGVYNFAGLFQSTIAALVFLSCSMFRSGITRGMVNEEHLHDLGKFMKAFTIFYAYIGFSQFLLIWYANLPEETIFYLSRSSGGWMAATISLFVFKFVAPFLLMLPRAAKRNHIHLTMVATWILFMQYIDIHWMVYPVYSETWILSWQELSSFLLFGGLFLWSVTSFLAKNSIIAVRDPRIDEALNHHVTY